MAEWADVGEELAVEVVDVGSDMGSVVLDGDDRMCCSFLPVAQDGGYRYRYGGLLLSSRYPNDATQRSPQPRGRGSSFVGMRGPVL